MFIGKLFESRAWERDDKKRPLKTVTIYSRV